MPSNAVMAMTCLGVLSMVTHLRTFSQQRLLLWREVASGVGMPGHFLASNIIDFTWIVTAPAIYLGPYYYLTLPVSCGPAAVFVLPGHPALSFG